MKYYLVSKSKNSGLALTVFEAKNTRDALLYIVDARSKHSKGDDYRECRGKSMKEIREHLAKMSISGRVAALAIFEAIDPRITQFRSTDFDRPVWSIFDYADADTIF